MDEVKDSTFVNLGMSIADIERTVNTPKKRGVRSSTGCSMSAMRDTLGGDIIKTVTSPLAQNEQLKPVSGLTSSAVESIRSLHSLLVKGKFTEEQLKASVHSAVDKMALSQVKKTEDRNEQEGKKNDDKHASDNGAIAGDNSTAALRRSMRLAQLPAKSYNEDLSFMYNGEDSDEGDSDEGDEGDEGETTGQEFN
ncbi:hypothetical protein V496_05217 [Pseudogymnoascus sp. VKM F-4515 (FW-2607)]|nr:hypothetical protein V496_05217 [Pseudogymnoascus sp. VKM F-4515 (FW-2607)]KFY98198.1 hypothetical protein V498_01604 [Pseudogymnoascus sp. VKM F-4517 (FW-2822)]